MNKGIFLDLDGTLLDNDYKISGENRKAIKRAQKAGWRVYIATGKSYTVTTKYAADLKLGTPLITSQGQIIIGYPFKVYKFITQDFGYTKKIFKSKLISSLLQNWTIETFDAFWTKSRKNNETLKLVDNLDKEIIEINKENERNLIHSAIIGAYFDIPKIDEKKLLNLIRKLNRAFPSKQFQYWYTEYDSTTITIHPRMVDKWTAIQYVKKIDVLDFVVSIGNGWSDRTMIINSNIGIAMKNSNEKVKESAKRVSKFDNNNSGVAYEINKILDQDNKDFFDTTIIRNK